MRVYCLMPKPLYRQIDAFENNHEILLDRAEKREKIMTVFSDLAKNGRVMPPAKLAHVVLRTKNFEPMVFICLGWFGNLAGYSLRWACNLSVRTINICAEQLSSSQNM